MPIFAKNLEALPGLTHGFGTVGDISKPSDLFYCAQKNGSTVIEVGEGQEAGVMPGDALFTRTARPIGIVTADCLPILIAI
ncbi:hypothetical protein G7009_08135 [Pseudomonas capeferrum]|uniref:laccase domain-containing protein n=1 Tax=Pseudomonas capeferrum TaxID=1495066 RepID=UPI0015E27D17|nr:laccase domain-containing protein [Pseudomonas capeferrum]MBA1201727.1 hypothetical protein [Pseudomonas capeferrum]